MSDRVSRAMVDSLEAIVRRRDERRIFAESLDGDRRHYERQAADQEMRDRFMQFVEELRGDPPSG